MTAPALTTVVVLHDSAPELARLLASLERFAPPDLQLVVVDSGSRDAGAAVARDHGAEVLELHGNPGFGAASNAGVARARADVCMLLNPDIVLLDRGIERLVRAVRERDALLAPRLLGADGRAQRSAHPTPGGWEALLPALVHPPALPRRLRLRAEPWRSPDARRVGWAIAACLVARTATLRRLGPFDPEAFLFYEDMDLCLRAAAAGVPTLHCPRVAVEHAGGHSVGRAFSGEPHDMLAARRREVVGVRLGRRALITDDAAQALTFATRIVARRATGRPAARPRAQLRALVRARRGASAIAAGWPPRRG